jgi:uncharacterized membrane protein YsdA (DUF1294 family)
MNQRNREQPSASANAHARSTNAPGRPHARSNPYRRFGFIFGGLAVLLALLLWWITARFDLLLAWLIAITAVTFAAYGYDKRIAGSGKERVPERILLGLAAAGGTIGALLGMRLFHHKTVKGTFRRRFWAVVVVQAILIGIYLLLR